MVNPGVLMMMRQLMTRAGTRAAPHLQRGTQGAKNLGTRGYQAARQRLPGGGPPSPPGSLGNPHVGMPPGGMPPGGNPSNLPVPHTPPAASPAGGFRQRMGEIYRDPRVRRGAAIGGAGMTGLSLWDMATRGGGNQGNFDNPYEDLDGYPDFGDYADDFGGMSPEEFEAFMHYMSQQQQYPQQF